MHKKEYYKFDTIDSEITKNTDKHIAQGDEDGTLATRLDFLRTELLEDTNKLNADIQNIVEQLMYKQKNYDYVPKNELPVRAISMRNIHIFMCDDTVRGVEDMIK